MVPPTVDRSPTSMNAIKIIPHRHIQRSSSQVILESVCQTDSHSVLEIKPRSSGWPAAALINKLFIVTKWLGQRLNINLKLKAEYNPILAKETGSPHGESRGEKLTLEFVLKGPEWG